MPTDAPDKTTASLQQGDNPALRMKLGEMGFNALRVVNGFIIEEQQHELRWPENIYTYREMFKDATISPCLELVEYAIASVPWKVRIPDGHEEDLKDHALFIKQNMDDMEHSWSHFIRQASTHFRYGFAVNEKVYRRRKKANGSKFDDGLIGIRKLPIRAQFSITGWDWDDSGHDLIGLYQRQIKPAGRGKVAEYTLGQDLEIPREKFLLFRNNPIDDNPYGTSALNSCWLAYKYKRELETHEAIGVVQDLRGFKVLGIPPKFMSESATDAEKATFQYFQNGLRNMHAGEQSGLIYPLAYDENGKPLFDFKLMSVAGQKAYDVNQIIERYRKEIITSLFASQLNLGGQGGSFALAESLTGITRLAIKIKLDEIKDQLNNDLIPQLFKLNGWDTEVLPYFDYDEIDTPDLDVLSKYIQRIGAVGLVPKTAEVVNLLMEKAGIPAQFDPETSDEDVISSLTAATSRSGDGMKEGLNNGTGSSDGSSGDASITNTENA